jgi:hypothetical protein
MQSVWFNQTNKTNQINQSNEPSPGGGFQHRLVDGHQVFLHLITTRHLFTGNLGPLPHGHAGTGIALYL